MPAPKIPPIAIVTDSSASLSSTELAAEGVEVVPLKVIIGADEFTEDDSVSTTMIEDALLSMVPVSTSRPTPEEFLDTFRRLKKAGAKHIVSIHLSAKMSGTVDSAKVAARQSKIPVSVVDTEQVGRSVGFAVQAAVRARAAGSDIDNVVAAAQRAAWRTTTLLYVDTLDYLKAGGRIGSAAALIGSALAVKPILSFDDGAVVPIERVRTSGRALARIEALSVEAAETSPEPCVLAVQHLSNPKTAEQVAERLAQRLEIDDIAVSEVGAAIGAHVGPGMIAITVTPLVN